MMVVCVCACVFYLELRVFSRHGSKVSFDAFLLLSLQRVDPHQGLIVHRVMKPLQLLLCCPLHLQTHTQPHTSMSFNIFS